MKNNKMKLQPVDKKKQAELKKADHQESKKGGQKSGGCCCSQGCSN